MSKYFIAIVLWIVENCSVVHLIFKRRPCSCHIGKICRVRWIHGLILRRKYFIQVWNRYTTAAWDLIFLHENLHGHIGTMRVPEGDLHCQCKLSIFSLCSFGPCIVFWILKKGTCIGKCIFSIFPAVAHQLKCKHTCIEKCGKKYTSRGL